MPLWKVLLIANGLLLLLFVLVTGMSGGSFDGSEVIEIVLIAITYCTPIGLLAHYSTRLIERHGRALHGSVRNILLIAGWMISGMLGSLITYVLLHLITGGRLEYGTTLMLPIIFYNGIIAIAIGTCIVFFEKVQTRFKRRSELLDQQDLLTAEFQAARNVQGSLLPSSDPHLYGFDISGGSDPAVEIGGDYYDYLSFADGTKGIVVADAAGKGIPAALVMAKFQGMAQALSIHVSDPREFFVGLNDTLRIRLDRRSFITVGMLTIDFDDRCTFYRAGHNPLLLCRREANRVETLCPGGMALGLTHGSALGSSIEPACFTMEAGDIALLYSDGLTEAGDISGEMYGEERLEMSLQKAALEFNSAAEIRDAIVNDLAVFVGSAEPHDDVTLVVVKKVGALREPF